MLFEYIDKSVQIGINPMQPMDPLQAHGAAQVVAENGAVVPVQFQVDYPNRLKNPTSEQLADIFKQFEKLGLNAVTLNIFAVGRRRPGKVFRRDQVTKH
jgi:hypothetical protein